MGKNHRFSPENGLNRSKFGQKNTARWQTGRSRWWKVGRQLNAVAAIPALFEELV